MWPFVGKAWRSWCETMFDIRQATAADIPAVTALEQTCFPPAEAASQEALAYRLSAFPERFFVAEEAGKIVAMVNGCRSYQDTITDDLFLPGGHAPKGSNQMIFGLATAPEYQGRGIATALMTHLRQVCQADGMKKIVLTCKAEKITFYEKLGYVNHGCSASTHGGAIWYDMVLPL